jgi:hypothetical protein
MRRWNTVHERLRGGSEGAPGSDLWGRIAASRARGGAVELPRERSRTLVRAGLLGALAGAVFLVWFARDRHPSADVNAIAAFDWAWPLVPEVVLAQTGHADHLPPAQPPDGRRLRPGRWVYNWTLVRGNQAERDKLPPIADTVTIRQGAFGGEAAWLVTFFVHRTGGVGAGRLDSLYLRLSDLQPLREALFFARPDRLETAMEMESDLVHGTFRWRYRVPGGGGRDTTVMLRLPTGAPGGWRAGGAWLSQLPILMGGLDLRAGWSGGVPLLSLAIGKLEADGVVPLWWMNARVKGRKNVSVPAGDFDCWIVDLSFPESEREGSFTELSVDVRSGTLVREVPGGASYSSRGRELAAVLP